MYLLVELLLKLQVLIYGFTENRKIKGSIGGIQTHTSAQKVWLVFQALGDIAFSYPYTQIVLEIQVFKSTNINQTKKIISTPKRNLTSLAFLDLRILSSHLHQKTRP